MTIDAHRRSVASTMRRVEDPRLITGGGRYVDDITVPGALQAVFVRSPEAHAIIRRIDVAEARGLPGVVDVLTASDLDLDRRMPAMHPSPAPESSHQAFPLAREEVCYVGEPVAVVMATERLAAHDAAESVRVELEPLPAVTEVERALASDAPPVHRHGDGNLVARITLGYGDVAEAFASADHVLGVTLRPHRGAAVPMEPRGVLAHPDQGRLTVWSSTQAPHTLRRFLADYLGLPEDDIRVVAPDVGGGFGPKAALYAEEYVTALLAARTERPVKWIETRRENMTCMLQSRDQVHRLEVAAASDGTLRGLRGTILHDNGAYLAYGVLPAVTGIRLTPGPYVVPALDLSMDIVYTNLTPTAAVRGAGRPYAVFSMERVMDAVARTVGIDRADVRRRNFVPADAFPYEIPIPLPDGRNMRYDSGEYHAALDLALERSDWLGVGERREGSAARGRLRGIGMASYVEDTGLGPFERARLRVHPDGIVTVDVGTPSQGQGHATVYAQIVARHLGVAPEQVMVRMGDTDHHPDGVSTVASRTAVTAGPSVDEAASELARLARLHAAELLEAAPADMVVEQGAVHVAGQPDTAISLADLAASLGATEGDHDGVLATEAASPFQAPAFAFGTHVAEVEVDPETGLVEVVGYTVAHDCGRLLNPVIVEGQIHGGVAHGLGNALHERLMHSAEGQPLTTTLMDYRIPGAREMPPLTTVHTETPSPANPLGVKGAGEGGTLPVAAAVASAVEDALSPHGVVIDRHPLTPSVVYRLLEEARSS